MIKLFSFSLLSLALFLFFVEPTKISAETFRINSTTVEGNYRISDDAIVNYSKLNLRSVLSLEELNEAYTNILETGLFKKIEFSRNGSALTIFVEEYPTINEISFEGNRRFTDDRLASFLTLKPRYVVTSKSLEKDLDSITYLYKNSGRLSARIQPKLINLSDNRVNLIFEIYEGGIAEIERINFVGNRAFSDRRLRRVLSSKQAGLLRRVITRDTMVSERIALDKRLLSEFYLERGFADFKIYDVNAELSEEKDGFFISYNIKEGPKFSFGKIEISSELNEIDVANFRKLIKINSGEVYSPKSIQAVVSQLEDALQNRGYNFVRVSPKINRNIENLTTNINFVLEKGDRVFVERIDITGNTATLDRVIRRQFFIVEGDPFTPNEIIAAKERILALGLFSDTSVDLVPGSTSSQIVVKVRVEEKPTGTLSFGAGYSSASGLGGIVEYSEKNFLGRGQGLSFSIRTGADDRLYELSFFEPMFLRNELGLGMNLSLKDTNKQNAAYDTENVMFQPFIIYPLGQKAKLKVDYSIIQTDLSNPGLVGAIVTDEVNEGKITSSSIGYELTNDSRLYKSGQKNGFLLRVGQQFYGLGGDNTGLKTLIMAAAQREAFKEEVKFSAVVEAGVLTYSSGNSRVTDRFFLSSNKMRGFEPGGLGPRECSNKLCGTGTNDALGGENYTVLRLEAEFPFGLPEEYGLSGGIFYDIGNVWSLSKVNDNVLYEAGSWRHSVGASIFWKTPIGPLRFNFTEALEKELYDKDESFDLTISTRF